MKYTKRLFYKNYFNYNILFKKYNFTVAILSIPYLGFCMCLIPETLIFDQYRIIKYNYIKQKRKWNKSLIQY